jgi:hypothetical protein
MKTWRTPLLIMGLCLGLSAVATVPFFFLAEPAEDESRWALRVPETYDLGYHVNEAEMFYEGLKTGCLYPIWLAGGNKGYGAPATAYYPPGAYYLLSGLYLLLKNWIVATLAAYLIMMTCSAAAMYVYARQWFSKAGAVFAMAAYIVTPFHLWEQYVRGTFGELMTYIWMPLLLLFTDRLFRRRSPSSGIPPLAPQAEALPVPDNPVRPARMPAGVMLNIAGLAICYGASLWSHVPSIHPFSLALGIYILILGVTNRDWKGMVSCGVALALALGLSAAYWYPAFLGRNLIWPGFIDPDVYHSSYVFGPNFHADAHIWTFNLVAILICAIVLLVATRRKQSDSIALRNQILLWAILGCFASFMTTSYSEPIGRRIPMISIAQRPYRMLMITALIPALLVGACGHVASLAKSAARKVRYVQVGIAMALLIITVGFSIVRVIKPVYWSEEEDLSGIAPRSAYDPDENDLDYVVPRTVPFLSNYLPNIDDLNNLPLSEPAILENGRGEVCVNNWNPQHRELSAELTGSDRVSIRTFNFPGWTARVDGRQAPLGTGAGLGEMVLDLDAGTHAITLDFLETPARRRGKLLNLAALIAFAGIVCVAFALKRRDHGMIPFA